MVETASLEGMAFKKLRRTSMALSVGFIGVMGFAAANPAYAVEDGNGGKETPRLVTQHLVDSGVDDTNVEKISTLQAQVIIQQAKAAAAADSQTSQARAEAYQPQSGSIPLPNVAGDSIVGTAMQYIGSPYKWGGTTPAGFDCSGFTQFVYALHGIALPHFSGAQQAGGQQVSAAAAQPGDLVVWGAQHVGIYAGNGMMIDAGNYSTGVVYRPVSSHGGTPTYVRY